MAVRRGAFIVIEGLDRSGKTTQVEKLVHRLNRDGYPAAAFRFPDRSTVVGRLLNTVLGRGATIDKHALHLLFTANRWEVAKCMEALINSGTTVVVDRYSYSGVAYSVASDVANDLDYDWCRRVEFGLPAPDLVCYLDVPSRLVTERPGFGLEVNEVWYTQHMADLVFHRFPSKSVEWVLIDGTQTIDEISDRLVNIAIAQIMDAHHQPLARFDESTI